MMRSARPLGWRYGSVADSAAAGSPAGSGPLAGRGNCGDKFECPLQRPRCYENVAFWELTNFGTNRIDLTGYRWNDNSGGLAGADATPFEGLNIGPGETILFVQNNIPEIDTPEEFRAWWGLPPAQQVVFYSGNGLSSDGDSVILWGPEASRDEEFVDRVDFGPATRGHSFTYDRQTGLLTLVSSNGLAGAFRAALSDDIASPGTHAGPVSLRITLQPTNQVGYVGFPVTFSVAAHGLPRPKYQWVFNGDPIPGATAATLTLPAVRASDEGSYRVQVTNGLEFILSSEALLIVDSSPAAPSFVVTPADVDAYPGQTVSLVAMAHANPPPEYQWLSNGIPLPGQTANHLVLPLSEAFGTAVYTVVASNLAGARTASARVTVTPKPRFLITEVHSTGSAEFQDWWELTSFDTRPFNLKGYRFDDDSRSLSAAAVITNDLVIHPGESIVFVETTAGRPMTEALFRSWWGLHEGPQGGRVVIYAGPGLGLSSNGDGLYLWNAAASADDDFICGVTFGAAATGPRQTFVYDPDQPTAQTPVPGLLTLWAAAEVNGAWVAANGDVGSPGRVIAPTRLLLAAPPGESVRLSWRAVPGRRYTVERRESLGSETWTVLREVVAEADLMSITDVRSPAGHFYRLSTILPFPAP